MNRTDRLIAMVLMLHSRKIVRARDMAEHFGIALRTVYRDMKALNEAGVPVSAEAGEGYSLVEGYHLPPVMFSKEEAGALWVGAELVRHFTDVSLKTHAESALMKIQSVLPADRKDFIAELGKATSILRRPPGAREGFRDDVLRALQEAIIQRHVVTLEYQSGAEERTTRRSVEPLAVLYYSNRWHLIAYCRLRKDYRDFRTDRIRHMVVSDERFSGHKDFSVQRYMEEQQRIENPIRVRVLFTKTAARYVRDQEYFGFVEKEENDQGLIMTFLVPATKVLVNWLLSFGPHVRVLSPPELNEQLWQQASKTAEHYRRYAVRKPK